MCPTIRSSMFSVSLSTWPPQPAIVAAHRSRSPADDNYCRPSASPPAFDGRPTTTTTTDSHAFRAFANWAETPHHSRAPNCQQRRHPRWLLSPASFAAIQSRYHPNRCCCRRRHFRPARYLAQFPGDGSSLLSSDVRLSAPTAAVAVVAPHPTRRRPTTTESPPCPARHRHFRSYSRRRRPAAVAGVVAAVVAAFGRSQSLSPTTTTRPTTSARPARNRCPSHSVRS